MVDGLRVALDDDVGLVDRPGLGLAVDEGGDLLSDAKLEAAGRRERREHGVERIPEPARERARRRRSGARASGHPTERSSRMTGRSSSSVLGELVDPGGGRRRQRPLRDDSARLEVAQAGGEDVRADAGEARDEVGVALRAAHQLEDDQERPPLADQAERVGHRAVLVVALVHARQCSE